MRMLIDGDKLLTHEEFYKKFNNFKEYIISFYYNNFNLIQNNLDGLVNKNHGLNKHLITTIIESKKLKFNIEFESKEKWDVIISGDGNEPPFINIEYKFSIDEWKKKFHDFLSQINNRKLSHLYIETNPGYPGRSFMRRKDLTYSHWKENDPMTLTLNNFDFQIYIKLLVTFDKRFEEYRNVLSENDILLLILPQELIDKNNEVELKPCTNCKGKGFVKANRITNPQEKSS